ncbi:MAG: serine hydrolase [Proteobacteria bacterium]|nr:serine hydrolase [Pseudomonadota bacterium]MDA1289252.1 serine hydrolase [Pseudomonadota bacterium]
MTNRLWMRFFLISLLFCQGQFSNAAEVVSAESVGMSSSALLEATSRLQQHIDDGELAGVVAAVARDGKLVYFESLGKLDLESGKPMPGDALFRIYSMAREVTSAAVLKLFEEGKFQLDDPVKMYLPEFEDQRVLLDSSSTDISQTKSRTGDITVAHLLTHTSGLGSRSSALYRENNVRDKNITLDQMTSNAARVPLFQDPGTQFRYGIHATILGKLVEIWSGQAFEEYLQENILDPLEMNSTMFWAEGSDVDRLAQLYRPTDGVLKPYKIESVPWTSRPTLIEGGVGLLSSVPDFLNFSQMILDGGKFKGKTILKEETAALMYQNGVPDQAMPIGDRGYWLGSGWTLGGFNLVMDPAQYSFPVSEGTIWWDGSAATRFFIDPKESTVIVIMAQVSPSSGGGFREIFSEMVDKAIIDRR